MTIRTVYKIYHWWEGDHVSSPCWVRTSTEELRYLVEVKEVINNMKRMGWSDFKVFKHTIENIALEQVEAAECQSVSATTPNNGKRSRTK
ncbi:MAG: hypothetical protein ACREPR_21785 [Brasilonema sp.]